MDAAKDIRDGESLDWKKLESYLRENLPELSGELSVAQFHGGHANLTYLLKFGDQELVLRRPPFGKIAPGAHDMKREYRVLSKLYKYFPRAPRAFHLCEDDSIVGAQFVVLERRKGVVLRKQMLECFSDKENVEARLVDAMIKAMAELHLVDYEAAELEKLGRPEGFLERQVAGWSKRWELSRSDNNEHMDRVQDLLQSNIPKSKQISIIHNDIKLDNCQFQAENPDKVTSVFDWDMCTLGDPLVDLGTALSYYPEPGMNENLKMIAQLKGDFPPKEFIIEKYKEYTGFEMDNIDWYQAFSNWKIAIVLQQLYKRYLDGDSKDKRMAGAGDAMDALAKNALHILENK